MRNYNIISSFYVFFIFAVFFSPGSLAMGDPVAGVSPSNTFFSQGQAVSTPRDQAKSQQMAVQDFMAQGLTRAMGSLLSPAQIGAQFSEIQKNILAKPSRYIDSYQVFSESQLDGMFG